MTDLTHPIALITGASCGMGRAMALALAQTGADIAVNDQTPAAIRSAGFACGGKRYCRDMTSGEEARFYLTQCGVPRLDGDHDGRPCETLCR